VAADLFVVPVKWTGEPGAPYFSQFWFGLGAIGDGTEAQDVTSVNTYLAAIKGNICAALSYAVGLTGFQVDSSTGQIVGSTAIAGAASACTGGANPLPFGTAGRIVWSTGIFAGGREIKGRFFCPAPDEVDNGAGVPTAGYLTAMNTPAAALIADANTTFKVYSRKPRRPSPGPRGGWPVASEHSFKRRTGWSSDRPVLP